MNATNGRELTLKKTSTASLSSRLKELVNQTGGGLFGTRQEIATIEAIEQELEERNEWESKVSRR